MSEETQEAIVKVCMDLADFLIEKNKTYGDSAVNPIRIRSTASPLEQILVRQDDKLNRILNGGVYAGDDDLKDLVGYWVLEQVVRRLDPICFGPKSNFKQPILGKANDLSCSAQCVCAGLKREQD